MTQIQKLKWTTQTVDFDCGIPQRLVILLATHSSLFETGHLNTHCFPSSMEFNGTSVWNISTERRSASLNFQSLRMSNRVQVELYSQSCPRDSRKLSLESAETSTTSSSQSGSDRRYKTELCRFYRDYAFCPFGNEECSFAHGHFDLRERRPSRKYKTTLCNNFFNNMSCPYGQRCQFSHLKTRQLKPKVFFQSQPVSYSACLEQITNLKGLQTVSERLQKIKPTTLKSMASALQSEEERG